MAEAADLPELTARFAAALRAAGLPAGPERCARFTRAVLLTGARTVPMLRWCARATLAAGPGQIEVLDRVFDLVFGGFADPAGQRGDPNAPELPGPAAASSSAPGPTGGLAAGSTAGSPDAGGDGTGRSAPDIEVPSLASAAEQLSTRDFTELSTVELAVLARLMSQLTLATPLRRSRRTRRVPAGDRVDLRATLRLAHRTGGDPVHLVRRVPRDKPRRLVVLCDISGSMAPYARAMLQLLYCAAGAQRAEVFTFATRLTRLTPVLARQSATAALDRAGRAAPDWSGGTRIGTSLAEFLRRYGRPGMARGAVVLIVSDGWETGDPALLGRQMAQLSRLAYRIVWVNPRTASPRYQPLVGGMAAAWPHCDAVVSAHRLTALTDLLAALADPVRRRRTSYRLEEQT